MRIKRHDEILDYIKNKNIKNKSKIIKEPHFKTPDGLRKPDLVVIRNNSAVILDAQIVGDQIDLNKANSEKINYYKNNASLCQQILSKYNCVDLKTIGITLNWRGIWSEQSLSDLLENKLINRYDIKVISSRTLIGGLACWNVFNRRTTTTHGQANRSGIG